MKYLCVGEEYESNGVKKMARKRIGEIFSGKKWFKFVVE